MIRKHQGNINPDQNYIPHVQRTRNKHTKNTRHSRLKIEQTCQWQIEVSLAVLILVTRQNCLQNQVNTGNGGPYVLLI